MTCKLIVLWILNRQAKTFLRTSYRRWTDVVCLLGKNKLSEKFNDFLLRSENSWRVSKQLPREVFQKGFPEKFREIHKKTNMPNQILLLKRFQPRSFPENFENFQKSCRYRTLVNNYFCFFFVVFPWEKEIGITITYVITHRLGHRKLQITLLMILHSRMIFIKHFFFFFWSL